jgi:hypothetical protein
MPCTTASDATPPHQQYAAELSAVGTTWRPIHAISTAGPAGLAVSEEAQRRRAQLSLTQTRRCGGSAATDEPRGMPGPRTK